MRVQLHDLSPGQDYAIQFRSVNAQGADSDWSQVMRFTTTDDTTAPGNVLNLQFYDSGDSYIATWNKVVVNEDGTPFLDFRYYHIHVTSGGQSADFYTQSENFELSRQQNAGAFGSFQTAVTISVTAVDLTYNESRTPTTATLDPAGPSVPSTPTIGVYIGFLLVGWDGKNNVGGTMPGNLVYCEVHVSTTNGFTPDATTLKGTLTLQEPNYVVSGLTYGTTYYVKLVAVNVLGKKSGASAQGTGSPQRISGLDIANGQISASQINFTAKDIGGANAYYVATTAARDALTGVKSGDIAYITGSGYATYRYDGTTWQSAPEIGVVSGTKILTGTLTSDAVGTNLLIAATANIADGIIDDAKISDLSAAKITAGTVSASIVMSGRFATALTGARVELNSNGLQQFASDGVTKLVDINASSATFTGTFQTSTSGRRTQITGNSSINEIFFIPPTYTGTAPNNKFSYIFAQTESDGTTEDIQFGVSNATLWPSAGGLWNRINYNSTGWANYQALKHTFVFGATTTGFVNFISSPDLGATATTRFQIDGNGAAFFNVDGTEAINMDSTSGNMGHIILFGNGPFKPGASTTTGGFVRLASPSDQNASSVMQFFNSVSGVNYGGCILYANDPGATNARFQFQIWDGSAYLPLWCTNAVNPSSETIKTDIADFSDSGLDIINSLRVREYHRKLPTGMNRKPGARKELGFIVEEAHPIIVESNDTESGIGLYQLATLGIRGVQETYAYMKAVEAYVKKLEDRIAELEGKK